MENSKHISLGFNAKIEPIQKINEEFTKVKIYVCSYGKNRNMTYISKEELDKAISTLSYCPVIAHLFKNEETGKYQIGGHDCEIEFNDDGVELKDLTVPFGVVIDNSFNYEDVEEYGKTLTYLTAEAYLWLGRYPNLSEAIYSDDNWFSQSMEIGFKNYRPYEQDSNYSDLLDINFSALCLLNKSDDCTNVEPCFISSHVEPIKFSLDDNFNLAFNKMKEHLSKCFNDNKIQEGGNDKLTQERINEILAEYEIKIEDLDFEIVENMTEEAFKTKLDDYAKKKKKCSLSKFAATYEQKRQALQNACAAIIVKNDEDDIISETYFWLTDFDDEYVYVEKNVWTEDNRDRIYGRFTYSFDETNLTANLTSEFEVMILTWLTIDEKDKLDKSRNAFELLQSEFDTYKSEHSTSDVEIIELQNFKNNTLAEQRINEENELFSQFNEKLNSDTEYEALKSNCKEMSLDEIRDKCFSILGKKLANFSLNKPKEKTIKVPVAQTGEENATPYGDVYDKYLNK